MTKYNLHIVDVDDKRRICKRYTDDVPRIGEEIRFNATTFATVKRVVWIYDEAHDCTRVNIGVSYEEVR